MKTKPRELMQLHLGDPDDFVRVTAVTVEHVSLPVPLLFGPCLYSGESIVIENKGGVLVVTAHREVEE
jgi:hypothetical protein